MKRTIRVPCYRRKKINGQSCWKIGHGWELLQRAGWQLVRPPNGRSSYAYMLPPPGITNTLLEIDVPTPEAVQQLAESLHVAGQPFTGEYAGYPVKYRPAHVSHSSVVMIRNGVKSIESSEKFNVAEFTIGSFDYCWDRHCRWEPEGAAWREWIAE